MIARAALALLVGAMLSAASGCALLGKDETEDRKLRVGASAKPNYALDIEAPKEVAAQIREFTLLGRWQSRAEYDPIQFPLFVRQAPGEIKQLLAAEGWFSPNVRVSGDPERGAKIVVEPGPRTTVERVDIDVQGALADPRYAEDRARLLENWGLDRGEPFRSGDWEKAKRQLVEAMRSDGFMRARVVDSRAAVDPGRRTAALEVKVDSGPLMHVGEIEIDGLKIYPRGVVTGLRPFRRGDRYRIGSLVEYQNRLRESGYFSAASVFPDTGALDADPALREVPVDVIVTEGKPQKVTIGLGYGTDEGFRAQLGYEHRNLFGRGWFLDSGITLDQVQPRWFTTLRTPYDDDGKYWTTGLRVDQLDLLNVRSRRASAQIGRGKRVGDITTLLSAEYQIEDLRVRESPTRAVDSVNRALVLAYSWNVVRVDSRLDPSRGYSLTTQVSAASSALGSDRSFARVYARGIRYIPLSNNRKLGGGRIVLIGELGAVAADSSEGIPQQNLFRAGGSRSVRGYDYQTLGVRRGDAVLGGRYLIVGSAEYQHPITSMVAAAVFYDRGNAFDSMGDFSTVAGAGAGLRLRTPLGPVNLDVARGLATQRWVIHFSIGAVF